MHFHSYYFNFCSCTFTHVISVQVHDDKASISYRDGESPEQWTDPRGNSFSLGQRAAQRGAIMEWKDSSSHGVAQPANPPAELARGKMAELNRGYGGAGSGGRYHIGVGRVVKELVSRHKASVEWHNGESPDGLAMGASAAGMRPKVSLGPRAVKRGAYVRSADPLKALESKMDRISSGYGGVGGRAHMVVGTHIRELVRRNKASVDWRDGESPRHPELEHRFIGRPTVRLGPKDFRVGAYIRVRSPASSQRMARTHTRIWASSHNYQGIFVCIVAGSAASGLLRGCPARAFPPRASAFRSTSACTRFRPLSVPCPSSLPLLNPAPPDVHCRKLKPHLCAACPRQLQPTQAPADDVVSARPKVTLSRRGEQIRNESGTVQTW